MKDKKKQLRKALLKEREALGNEDFNALSHSLCQSLGQWFVGGEGRPFKKIFLFLSYRKEPNLLGLFNYLPAGVSCFLPVVLAKGEMRFAPYKPGDALTPNRYGILEPEAKGEWGTAEAETAVLVPALAVDRAGHRLGYGGGYYDRFLAAHPRASGVAVVFSRFFMEEIPVETLDHPLPLWASELGVRWLKGGHQR